MARIEELERTSTERAPHNSPASAGDRTAPSCASAFESRRE